MRKIMKNRISIAACLITLISFQNVFANLNSSLVIPDKCLILAENEIKIQFADYFLTESDGSQRRFADSMSICKLDRRGYTKVICTILADNGSGGGDVLFQAKLSADCEQVISTKIVSEE